MAVEFECAFLEESKVRNFGDRWSRRGGEVREQGSGGGVLVGGGQ